jgi:hypothetical protein
MSALPVSFDPYNPIPNTPFYYPPSYYLQGPVGPLVIGAGLSVSPLGVISSTGGGGGAGTVTQILTGPGLTGGPIVNSGTISLAPSGVSAGSYTFSSITVDTYGRIIAANSGSPVVSVAANSPLSVGGSVTAPTISIQLASTTQVGATQLNNTTSSTLTNQALTAAAGKNLQDQINALSQNANGLILAGTLDASTGNVVSATTAGNSGGFTAGSPVPAASPTINNYYLIVTTGAASYTPTGGAAITNVNVGDYILVSSGVWTILRVGPVAGAYATTTTAGIVELATALEAVAGTNPNVALTPFTGAATYFPKNTYTTKGQIVAGTGSSTFGVLAPGIDSYVLTADSSCSNGIKWAASSGGGGGGITSLLFNAPLTASTNPVTAGSASISINAASTAAQGAVRLADNATTIAGLDSTTAVTPLGAASTYVAFCDFTAKAQIIASTAACAYTTVTAGVDGQALIACAACSTGLTFGNPLAPATPTVAGAVYGIGQPGATVNFAVGCNALNSATTGAGNTALGIASMALMTTGSCNVGVGICSLYTETTGNNNTAVGAGSLNTQNGASGNTAIGYGAGNSVTTGVNNVALGLCSADSLTSGSYNTFTGSGSGCGFTTGCFNVAIGDSAGFLNPAGCANVYVGACAGRNNTSGSNVVIIGAGGCSSTLTVSNEVSLYNGCAVNGTARLSGTTGAWSFASDARLKQNVTALPLGLNFVQQVQPREFEWKESGEAAVGFIAQELDGVIEQFDADHLKLVIKDDPEKWMVAQTQLIPVLVNAIKELAAEVAELKAKLG